VRKSERGFRDRIINMGLWFPRLPDMKPSKFYLSAILKDTVFIKNLDTKDCLKRNMQTVISSVPPLGIRSPLNDVTELPSRREPFQRLL